MTTPSPDDRLEVEKFFGISPQLSAEERQAELEKTIRKLQSSTLEAENDMLARIASAKNIRLTEAILALSNQMTAMQMQRYADCMGISPQELSQQVSDRIKTLQNS